MIPLSDVQILNGPDDSQEFLDKLLSMPDIEDSPRPQKLPMARAVVTRRRPAAQDEDKQGVPIEVLRSHDVAFRRVFVVLTLAEAEALGRLWSNEPAAANGLAKIRLATQVR